MQAVEAKHGGSMDWVETGAVAVYVLSLSACIVTMWRLALGGKDTVLSVRVAWILSAVSFVVGFLIAAAVAPDFSLFAVLWFYLPFFAVTAWSGYFAWFLAGGEDSRHASRRALVFAVPSLLLEPLAMSALWLALRLF